MHGFREYGKGAYMNSTASNTRIASALIPVIRDIVGKDFRDWGVINDFTHLFYMHSIDTIIFR